jgi:hypothetical protein
MITTSQQDGAPNMAAVKTRLIDGRDIEYEDIRAPISDLVLDVKNPRIQFELKARLGGNASDEKLDELLWSRDSVKRLYAAIKQDGGVSEPLFLRALPDGKYLVLEGNQRTVATRHLRTKEPNNHRFSTVPAWVFGSDLTDSETASLLAELHVAGKDEWPPYEQAKHIFDFSDVYGKSQDWIATKLRLSKSQVGQKMLAYQALNEYIKDAQDTDLTAIKKFSFFEELMKKRPLKEQYTADPDFKKRFQQWVKHDKLIDAKDVRKLPEIFESPDALHALENDGIKAAERILITENPELGSDLFASIKRATEYINSAPQTELKALKSGDAKKLKIVRDLHRALEDMASFGGFKL